MQKVLWNELSENQKILVNDLVIAIHFVDEILRYIEEELFEHPSDLKIITDLTKSILAHHYTPICQVRLGENKYVCRKPNYLSMNPKPENTRQVYQDLSNGLSLEFLRQLEKVEIKEPLKYDTKTDFMKPFKSRLSYSYPKTPVD